MKISPVTSAMRTLTFSRSARWSSVMVGSTVEMRSEDGYADDVRSAVGRFAGSSLAPAYAVMSTELPWQAGRFRGVVMRRKKL